MTTGPTGDFPTRVLQSRQELRAAIAAARRAGQTMGLVPTMGALHAGHLSLVDASRAECDLTIATIFVNPTQFAPGEDLETYPRMLATDVAALAEHGADLVFAPSAHEVYRPGHETYVEVGSIAAPLEGAGRPGHFRGVATVVLKLFQLVPADVAYFGQKDYQQTLVVRRMAKDFDLPIEIRVCPTVREPDGLAMSSRNAYLTAEERRRARALFQALQIAKGALAAGERRAEALRRRVVEHLESVGGIQVEYVALVREGTVDPVAEVDGPTVVVLAARVGRTRLIDNCLIGTS